MTTPGTRAAPYAPFTIAAANANLDTWIPGDGRTTVNIPTFLDHNKDFNIADFTPGGVALGVSATVDTAATQAAVTEAGAYTQGLAVGARVLVPPRNLLLNDQIVGGAGVLIGGHGSRGSRFTSSYPGYAFKLGTTGGSLAYGCGIRDVSINLTNAAGGVVQAIGTSGFSAADLYFEGLVSSTNNGVFLDGGNAANIFSVLKNVDCNHIRTCLRMGTTGSQVATSSTAIGFNALTDLGAAGVGILIDALSGAGSRFFGGNIEGCVTGVSISGFACQFFGMRFEGNTTDLLLNSGAQANVFVGCSGWSVTTDNSGNTTNSFWGNRAGDYTNQPRDTLSRIEAGLTFGPDSSSLTNPTALAIANNATGTLAIGNCAQLLVYDSGVTGDAAELLLTPNSSGTKLKLNQINASYSLTPTTAGKLNFSLSGSTLSIENKLGSNTTVHFMLTKLV